MRRRVFVATAAAGAALLPGRGIPQARAQAPAPAWEDIVGPGGLYRLRMPKGYRFLANPRPDGGTLRQYTFTFADRVLLDFMVTDFVGNEAHLPAPPAELAKRLVAIQGGMEKSWPGATVLEQGPIQLGAVPGRRFVLGVEQCSGVLSARVYFSPKALYVQVAHAPAGERQDPAIALFMDSLSLAG